jgi:uncharacterized protein (DUF433 family)
MSVSVLEREMYSEAEAARLLRLPQSTLHYWLEGGERRGKVYMPVIRVEPRGERAPVTWAEFIEAGLLRQYRRQHKVPMAELRDFIDGMRARSGSPYPLAHHQPFIAEGRQLVSEIQEEADLPAEFSLVATVRGQFILTPAAEMFVERVTWSEDVATGWRPHDDPRSPVRMDPEFRFGKPAVKGVSTEIIWEQDQDGADVEETAEAFSLEVSDVRWALAYETSLRAA